jgi:hypothetical protein
MSKICLNNKLNFPGNFPSTMSRKRKETTRFLQQREIQVDGRDVEFPNGTIRMSADLVVVEVDEGASVPYRFVKTNVELPDKALVTTYDGDRKTAPKFKKGVTKVSTTSRRHKKNVNSHSVAIPGYRFMYSLSSKPSRNWPFERFINESALGGFLDSSRKNPGTLS